jgi:hypothetical protein
VARDQREAIKALGIHIQVATAREDFLFGGVEAIKFVREGENLVERIEYSKPFVPTFWEYQAEWEVVK